MPPRVSTADRDALLRQWKLTEGRTRPIALHCRLSRPVNRCLRRADAVNCADGVSWTRLAKLSVRRAESHRVRGGVGGGGAAQELMDDGGRETPTGRRFRSRRSRQRTSQPDYSPQTTGEAVHHDARSVAAGGGESSMRAKRRGVQMLSVVVVLFFVCWTPMYVVQTWSVFDYFDAVRHVSPTAMNYIHLLAFVSSCCNPITYCFMSAKFRQGFADAFRCGRRPRRGAELHGGGTGHHPGAADATSRSMLMMTTRERRVTTTSAISEHDVVVSHQL